MALILAVISWAVCPIIPAIVALVLAANASKEIAASGGRIEGQGLVTAAKVVSWVNIGLWAAILVVGVVLPRPRRGGRRHGGSCPDLSRRGPRFDSPEGSRVILSLVPAPQARPTVCGFPRFR